MTTLLNIIRLVRARTMRFLVKPRDYMKRNTVKPLSTKYGFDRGKPIDRYFIEEFLAEFSDRVHGRCMEVVDATYIKMFGGDKVTQADVIDLFVTKQATIHGDLRNLYGVVKSNSFDCLIITQTLHVNDDYEAAIKECYRILKPGGTLLATFPTVSPTWNLKINMWRLSIRSAEHVFGKYFNPKSVTVKGYGNKLASTYFWMGAAIEDITENELGKTDVNAPTVIGIVAVK